MSRNCLFCMGGESLNAGLLDKRAAWQPPPGLSRRFNPPGETGGGGRRAAVRPTLCFLNGDAEFPNRKVLFAYNDDKIGPAAAARGQNVPLPSWKPEVRCDA